MSNNKFKVLIVEDEANICSFIETLLTTNDYPPCVSPNYGIIVHCARHIFSV